MYNRVVTRELPEVKGKVGPRIGGAFSDLDGVHKAPHSDDDNSDEEPAEVKDDKPTEDEPEPANDTKAASPTEIELTTVKVGEILSDRYGNTGRH